MRGGAIGDFIFTLPVLRALRDRWPDACVEIIGYPHVAHLALAGGLVSKVHSLDRAGIARLFARNLSPDEHLRNFFDSFDVVISFLHDPDGVVQTNLLAMDVDLIYRSPVAPQIHAVDHLLKSLESMAIYESGVAPSLSLDEATREPGRRWLAVADIAQDAVAIHAGSGSPRKNWPLERFLDVSCALLSNGLRPFFVLGEADHAIEPAVRSAATKIGPVMSGKELLEAAGILSCCAGFVGNDSGVTHVAASVGIPVVSIFGPTDPALWAPRGPRVRVLRAQSHLLEDVTTAEVLAAWRSASLSP